MEFNFRLDYLFGISRNSLLIKIIESEQHKDDVRNRIMAQRIKRLIQMGDFVPLKQENLEVVVHARPLSTSSTATTRLPREATKDDDKITEELDEFAKSFSIRKRCVRRVQPLASTPDTTHSRLPTERLAVAASGVDLESAIIERQVCSFISSLVSFTSVKVKIES